MKWQAANRRNSVQQNALTYSAFFLSLAQLIGYAQTGEWLRTGHVVEATRMWLASNDAECDWLDRVKLAQMSADLEP